MYIYSGIVVIWEPIDFDLPTSSVICALRFASGTNDTVRWLMKIFGSQMTTMPSKWTLLLYCQIFEGLYLKHIILSIAEAFNANHYSVLELTFFDNG